MWPSRNEAVARCAALPQEPNLDVTDTGARPVTRRHRDGPVHRVPGDRAGSQRAVLPTPPAEGDATAPRAPRQPLAAPSLRTVRPADEPRATRAPGVQGRQ